MAETELEKIFAKDSQGFLLQSEEVEKSDIAQPSAHVEDILEQRRTQRKVLFAFSRIMSWISLLFIVTVVTVQAIIRIQSDASFELINSNDLKVLTIGVFGQITSVIIVITKSLWDDSPYEDLLKEDYSLKKTVKV